MLHDPGHHRFFVHTFQFILYFVLKNSIVEAAVSELLSSTLNNLQTEFA